MVPRSIPIDLSFAIMSDGAERRWGEVGGEGEVEGEKRGEEVRDKGACDSDVCRGLERITQLSQVQQMASRVSWSAC